MGGYQDLCWQFLKETANLQGTYKYILSSVKINHIVPNTTPLLHVQITTLITSIISATVRPVVGREKTPL